ncbi:DUF3040 domain-containing protein [Spirillospora sp. NPDC048911]|uniref:DUF3040 domain-containing protein n=1 Tax=Spirillospora sp. NPDC048911 TaxID=3364527 RepID=UPI003716C240
MGLSAAEHRVLDEIAERTAAEDPAYGRRLAAFGGYEGSALGLPSRWALLPVVLVGLLMLVVFFAAVIATASHDDGAGSTGSTDSPSRVHLRP